MNSLISDRGEWATGDPYYLAEALLSLAILPALTRTTYIMAVSETLGPLLISLKAMFKVGTNTEVKSY
jgi:hypothetical protein